jgi:hypothetical protein
MSGTWDDEEEEDVVLRVVDEVGRALEPDEIRLIVAAVIGEQIPKILRTELRKALLYARGRVD